MQFEVSETERRQAKLPHDLFLINLIANHILIFVSTLGFATSWIWPVLSVPAISVVILGYSIWRGRRSRQIDPWYVMCHWQVGLRRSLIFITMLGLLALITTIGLLGHYQFGLMKEAVYAIIGGIGLLPTMVTMLILIILESDALHSASIGRLPAWVVERYPNPDAICIADCEPPAEGSGEAA
jgi:hypothetical protein